MNGRLQFFAVLLVAGTFVPAGAAQFPDGSANIGDEDISVRIEAAEGQAPGSQAAASRPLINYDVTYEVIGDGPAKPGDLSGLCLAAGDASDPTFGFQYRVIGTSLEGKIVVDRLECVPFTDDDTSNRPELPALPQPPTVGEAWASARLPAPVVTLDPASRGITGLETRISTSGPTTLSISAAIRGYTITGTAILDHYEIAVDGAPPVRADEHRYTFETTGVHRLTITAVWRGTATVTGPDLATPVVLGDIGTASMTRARNYQVNEIRSVLRS
jgi:hypothetical protein